MQGTVRPLSPAKETKEKDLKMAGGSMIFFSVVLFYGTLLVS